MLTALTAVQIAQGVIAGIPEAEAVWETVVNLVQGGSTPTAAQQAQIDAAVDAAHAALQSS